MFDGQFFPGQAIQFEGGFARPPTFVEVEPTDDGIDGSDLDEYTFSGLALGDAHANRKIAIGIAARDSASTAAVISALTVAGVSASEVAFAANTAAGNKSIAAVWVADVPTGTSGDVVVTFSEAVARCAVMLWRVVSRVPMTVAGDDASYSANLTNPSLTIDVPGRGGAVGMAYVNPGAGAGVTWTGLGEDIDTTFPDNPTTQGFSGAHLATLPTLPSRSITVTGTSGQNCLAVATFAPY